MSNDVYGSVSGWTTHADSDITLDTTNKGVTYTNVTENAGIGRALTVSDSKWICQFEFNMSALTTNDLGTVSITSDYTVGFKDTGIKTITFQAAGANYWRFVLMSGQTNSYGETVSSNNEFALNTTYYVDMIRDGTVVRAKIWTNAERSGTPHVTLSDLTIGTTCDGMDGIQHWSETTNDAGSGWVRNVNFYDGVTSVTPATWTMEPTFEDDSFSSGWDRTGTQIATNSGSGEIDWNARVNGTNHSLVHDLQDELGSGVYLGTQYVARFKITVDVIQSGGFAGGNNIIFGFSDSADSVGYTTAQDFHGLKLQQDGGGSGSTKFKHIAVNNTNLEASGTNFATSLTTQTYYVELVRDGNDFTTKLLDSNYSVLTEEESTTVTNIQLRYFKISEDNGFSSSANFSGTVDNIELYNGVTSIN
jgi:hypothetical protein